MANDLTAESLRLLVTYDPETGELRQRNATGRHGCWKAGRAMGSLAPTGYITIRLQRRLHQAHRLVWLYVRGEWPKHDIDHINGVRTDNRIENLRDVPNEVNRQNTKRARIDSVTGVQGVRYDARRCRYVAQIKHKGRSHYLGSFGAAEAARAAYVAAKARLHQGWVPPDNDKKEAP